MKLTFFLWESAAVDRDVIVAGAYSAEAALATKAGSHFHRSWTSLLTRTAQRTVTRFLAIIRNKEGTPNRHS
jgi:hypothetical protein